MAIEYPGRGVVFWPVGTGDCTTVFIDADAVLQADLNHRSDAEEAGDPHTPIIDELKTVLPLKDGRPYLSVFALTHPDEDHCKGFERLLEEVTIGELWATPRIFREYKKDLCEDALAFRAEMRRRRDATIAQGSDPGPGNRVRLFGWDELLEEEDYDGFPTERFTVPGHEVTQVDGSDYDGTFRAFVHAPFKDDSSGERNDTSLGLQVTLTDSDETLRVLLLGDLCYPTIRKIFDRSDDPDLYWDILLAPHHCSKSVMYWKDDGDDEETLRQDVLNDLERVAEETGWIVASAEPIPATNSPGDDPPHAKAKARYQEIAPDGFLCTQEYPNQDSPEPIVFVVTDSGVTQHDPVGDRQSGRREGLTAAVAQARGSDQPPSEHVGFGGG